MYGDDNRLREAKRNGVTVATYQYNGNGERVARTAGGTTTLTLYDEAGRWIGDYQQNGTPIQQAVWMDDLPVGLLVGSGATQQLHYIKEDEKDSPCNLDGLVCSWTAILDHALCVAASTWRLGLAIDSNLYVSSLATVVTCSK